MNEEEDDSQRFETELLLLQAAYPEQVEFHEHARELLFTGESHSSLLLRIPDNYPGTSLPEILSATGSAKQDLRAQLRKIIHDIQAGQEVLDIFVTEFQDLVSSSQIENSTSDIKPNEQHKESFSIVIIWLHHLLATSKRKLAIAPSSSISGITKPGYPGVMLFSGSAAAVSEHVDTLKQENWQAFQVRFEEAELWTFAHGSGVKEVETMGEVVKELGEEKKNVFLEAMRLKGGAA